MINKGVLKKNLSKDKKKTKCFHLVILKCCQKKSQYEIIIFVIYFNAA